MSRNPLGRINFGGTPPPLGRQAYGVTPIGPVPRGLTQEGLRGTGAPFTSGLSSTGYRGAGEPTPRPLPNDPFRVVPSSVDHLNPGRKSGQMAYDPGGLIGDARGYVGDAARGAWDFIKENPEIAFRALETIGGAFTESGSEKAAKADVERQKRQDAARREVLKQMAESRRTRDQSNPYLAMYRS